MGTTEKDNFPTILTVNTDVMVTESIPSGEDESIATTESGTDLFEI